MKQEYYKIRADFKYADKGRFYRVFLVRNDITLSDLGEFIVEIFGGTMEHFFLYKLKDKQYVHSSWLDGYYSHLIKQEAFDDKLISDLPESFEFDYDTGDGWDFKCKIYKKVVVKEFEDEDDICFGYVLDGKGMGIWEDNIRSLYAYLEGEIDKDYNQIDEERGIFKPWNFDIDKYSEFDDPINIEELNDLAMYFEPLVEYNVD